jgi:branched-chain amino acid transport system substrate-binding protein
MDGGKMKKTIIFGIIALLLLAACGTNEVQTQVTQTTLAAKEPAVVKIGATLPLTGDVAFLGETSRNAMELALKEIQGTKYKYELVFEDDKLDAKLASTTATKLISVDKVDAIISLSSGTGNVVTPLAEQNKVIHFGIASDSNVAKGNFNFIHWTPPDEEAKVWVQEAQKRGYKRIASIFLQHPGALAILDSVKKYMQGTDMEFVFDETIVGGDKDFRTLLVKARQSKPDVYFIGAFSPELDILHKQLKEMGIKEPLTTVEAFELSNDPSQFEGHWYVNAADPSGEFLSKYKAAYNKDPQMGAPNAYDILSLIVEGFERAGKDPSVKPSPEEVSAALMQIKDFDGALGKLTVGEEGIVWSPAVVRMIQNGKPVTIR